MDTSRFHVVLEASLQITEVVPFGVTPREVRSGSKPMPAEGVRSNLIIEGTVSGEINGRIDCVDYYRILPNGDGRTHSHGIITTDDDKRIDMLTEGVAMAQPGGKLLLSRFTMQLHAADPALSWVNREPYFVVGETDLETYEISITCHAATRAMEANQ